jgi:hypothetical protein
VRDKAGAHRAASDSLLESGSVTSKGRRRFLHAGPAVSETKREGRGGLRPTVAGPAHCAARGKEDWASGEKAERPGRERGEAGPSGRN